MVHLVWNVSLPGTAPLSIVYDNTSILNNLDDLDMGITTMLTQYQSDKYIESIIIVTLLMGVTFNNSNVQCGISNLDSMSANLYVNTSGIVYIIILEITYLCVLCYFSSS